MRRCGCGSDTCTCVVEGGVNATVSGTGTKSSPYRVNVTPALVTVTDTSTLDMAITGDGSQGTPYVISGSVLGGTGGGSSSPQIDVITTPTSYPKPTGKNWIRVIVIGGGGGGGSGRRGAINTARFGGGGGAGGGMTVMDIPVSMLGVGTSCTLGAAGTGGAAVAVDSTNGNPGTAGGTTLFGSVSAGGGGGGAGGTATTGTGGVVALYGTDLGTAGQAGAATNPLAPSETHQYFNLGPTGGGGGGGIESSNNTNNGGYAGNWFNRAGASGGQLSGNPAQNGVGTGTYAGSGGGGAASAGAGASAGGGKGSNYGGGGGGGGASPNGTASGKGGDGAPGVVVVIAW